MRFSVLTNRSLVDAYYSAIRLKLDIYFIQMLEIEIKHRKMTFNHTT